MGSTSTPVITGGVLLTPESTPAEQVPPQISISPAIEQLLHDDSQLTENVTKEPESAAAGPGPVGAPGTQAVASSGPQPEVLAGAPAGNLH